MAVPRQPGGRALAVGEAAGRIVRRAAPCRRRGAAPPPRPAAGRRRSPRGLDPGREEAGDLGDRARVPHEPGRGIEGEQEGGGVHPRRDRHRSDGSRRSGRARRDARAASRPASTGSRSGTSAATGIAHRKARELGGRDRRRGRAGGAGRPPEAWTVSPRGRRTSTATVPSRSVRKTRAPDAASRSSVARAGWPYGLPVPADAIATRGRTASTNGLGRCGPAAVVRDLEQVERAAVPRPRSDGSMASSTSPASRNRYVADRPEQHDRDVVDARCRRRAARVGTCPRIGPQHPEGDLVDRQRVAGRETEPDRCARTGQRGAATRRSPDPGPRIPGSKTRPTRYRVSSRARPATWSSCGWLRITASIRRSHGGIRSSRTTRSRVRIGPAVDEQPAAARALDEDARRPVRRRGPSPGRRPPAGSRHAPPATTMAPTRTATDRVRARDRTPVAAAPGVAGRVARCAGAPSATRPVVARRRPIVADADQPSRAATAAGGSSGAGERHAGERHARRPPRRSRP